MAGRWGTNHLSYFVKFIELKIAQPNTQHSGVFPKVRPGRKSKIDPLCGLARGNPQWLEVLYLFRKSKILWSHFCVDLKAQFDKSIGSSCGVNSRKKIHILSIDWIKLQCYQKHDARIGISRALFKPV
jgi:hypothetical protein